MKSLIIVLFPFFALAQCDVPNYMITDQTTSDDIIRMRQGTVIAEREKESFIWRLFHVHCSESADVVIMLTKSGRYFFTHDDVMLSEWLAAPSIVKYYNDNVRRNENWAYRPYYSKIRRCVSISKKGIRCKRLTYSLHSRCWQHE